MKLTSRARVASRAVVELAPPAGDPIRAVVTNDEYDALATGILPERLTGGADGWRLLRAAAGMVTFDTGNGLLHEGDWYPGDDELPPLIGTASGATMALEPGMIIAWNGDDATLSPEAETMLAEAQARGI